MNLNLDCFRDTLKFCIAHIDYEETNHSLKFIEDTAQKCAVTATAAIFNNLSNPMKNP